MVATLRLEKKVAIVTVSLPAEAIRRPQRQLTCPCSPQGAGNGIGLESALLFAQEGAHVVCADINGAAAERAVKLISELEGGAPKALAVVADVGKEADIKELVKKAVAEFGRLDVML